MAKDDATDRAGYEAHRVGQERGKNAVEFRARVGEEHLAKDQGGGGSVEEELIPLHYRAGHGGRYYLLQSGRLDVRLLCAPQGGVFRAHANSFGVTFDTPWTIRLTTRV